MPNHFTLDLVLGTFQRDSFVLIDCRGHVCNLPLVSPPPPLLILSCVLAFCQLLLMVKIKNFVFNNLQFRLIAATTTQTSYARYKTVGRPIKQPQTCCNNNYNKNSNNNTDNNNGCPLDRSKPILRVNFKNLIVCSITKFAIYD